MGEERRIRHLLATAGIEVGGRRPWDIQVHDTAFYSRVAHAGSLGLGEAYMEGWWDAPCLDQFFTRVFAAGLDHVGARGARARLLGLVSRFSNRQTPQRSLTVARRHYDAGNGLFQAMLDHRMIYTAGIWDHAATLDEAQEAKLDFVCRWLELLPGMQLLDIGCGWGGLASFAARRFGVQVTGLTLSREQLELGRQTTSGLTVELRLEDYRAVQGNFDRIVSLGMFEHVGYRNYRSFFAMARRCLRPGGRMLLSTIGVPHTVHATDPWIERYIFPNSHLPSIEQIAAGIESAFQVRHWDNRPEDYDRTLMAWWSNFEHGWDDWVALYGEAFCRMWKYYLLSCAAAFRTRQLQDWYIALEPIESAARAA